MSDLVPTDKIESIVGRRRHATEHYGRVIFKQQKVYILHSVACQAEYPDLRDCPFSVALANGIAGEDWVMDRTLPLRISNNRLVPKKGATTDA